MCKYRTDWKPAIADQVNRTTDGNVKAIYGEMGNILSDPTRRLLYDTMRVTTKHKTSEFPGSTHHAPGMHHVIKNILNEQNLKAFPDIWSRAPKSKDVTHPLKVRFLGVFIKKRN